MHVSARKITDERWKDTPVWSVVENRRVSGRRVVQRQVLSLGELNDNQRAGWVRTIEAISGEKFKPKQLALFPDDREELPILACETIRVRLDKIELHHPRDWDASWLGLHVWNLLELDTFWRGRLPSSRKGTSWLNMLKALVCYRLIDSGSEFRFHREWYVRSAMGDQNELPGEVPFLVIPNFGFTFCMN